MSMELAHPTFVKWLKSYFDHRVTGTAWEWDSRPTWRQSSVSIECITCAFENSAQVFAPYSDAQLNQGFWALMNESDGEIHALFDDALPLSPRLRCIRSIFTVFEQCFAKRCSSSLLRSNKQASPLNSVCQMWWDIFPTWGEDNPQNPAHQQRDEACLNVMKQTLYLKSDACRESALHGLGHWHSNYSSKVETIIDDFLESHPKISPELRDYALKARKGDVL